LPAERRQPLKIEVPDQKQETLRFGRVGLIVTAGFVIGIIWPRVAGFKLVPSVPSQPAESSSADLTGAPGEAKGTPTAVPPPVAAPEPPVAVAPDRLQISEPQFLACKENGKKRKDECDHIEFDRLARPHIQALAACAGADKLLGVLSLGFDLDFTSQAVKNVKSGKSTTFTESETDTLLDCEKKEFENVSLVGIAHKHDTYSVFYKVEFPKSPSAVAEKADAPSGDVAPADVTEASGHATVAWDVALVRSSASRDGAVVARVLQGTRVSVTGRRGDWYRIKYDVKGSVGWVYRTAIGM
jgi:Bacterial SH3 domain